MTTPPFNDTYRMNHTCLHVKNPEESVKFYEEKFGMKHFQTLKPPGFKITLYLLAYDTPKHPFHGVNFAAREGVLELCYADDTPADFEPVNGNAEPFKGFGHICVSVDNIEAACSALEQEGVSFKKRLTDGRQKDIAFALDPNNYWIELIEHGKEKKEGSTDKATWLFNHSMIRVKDPVKSLHFYQQVLGMKLFSKREFPNAQFDLYFLGYDHNPNYTPGSDDKKLKAARQAIVELTHNYGTESDRDFSYFTGSKEVHGFGHLAVSCNNPQELVSFMKETSPETVWTMEYDSSGLPIGFFNDPDGYSVEVLLSSAFT